MFITLPIEIIAIICDFDTRLLNKLLISSKKYNNELLKYIRYIRIIDNNIYDKHLIKLSQVIKLDIYGSYSRITDNGLKELKNINHLRIQTSYNITDIGLKFLSENKNIKIIDLQYCNKITD